MKSESIKRIEILETGEILLGLESDGNPDYQYIYRETAGVYWDSERHGFKSTPIKKWSCAEWFDHIVRVVRDGLGVELHLGGDVHWENVPPVDKDSILDQATH
jgi:hypothetical protein